MNKRIALIIAFSCTVALSACENKEKQIRTASGPDAEVVNAQNDHRQNVEVTITAPVQKLLRDDTQGLQHQRFLIALSNGSTVKVAHDISIAPRVPLNVGDSVSIHGEYGWNDKGGYIHWTHHADRGNHEGGWIEYAGRKYE